MITIHTLSIMRNEIRVYKSLIKERDKLIKDYQTPLKKLENDLLEVEEKLKLTVNREKSRTVSVFAIRNFKFLGFA